jgi:hypothetical protein
MVSGTKFNFFYLYNSIKPLLFVYLSWDTHHWDHVHYFYGSGLRIGLPNLELYTITFEFTVVYSIHPRIMKKKNSLEFTVEGYKNINKVVFYTWKTFLDWFL